MKKNKKLSLKELQVKSFVTELVGMKSKTVKGGLGLTGDDPVSDPPSTCTSVSIDLCQTVVC